MATTVFIVTCLQHSLAGPGINVQLYPRMDVFNLQKYELISDRIRR